MYKMIMGIFYLFMKVGYSSKKKKKIKANIRFTDFGLLKVFNPNIAFYE